MSREILGIHHVTAIAGDAQTNLDFYAGVLGLRLVKRTVNFDDPGTYHFYFGVENGHPGTILTFFPWSDAPHGRRGTGQTTTTSFSVPFGSLGWWMERLKRTKVRFEGPETRFDEELVTFADPDGVEFELVTRPQGDPRTALHDGPVPAEHAIRGFYAVTLAEEGFERTAGLLTGTLGFRVVGESGNRFRFESGTGGPGTIVDVLCLPDAAAGVVAVGTVHHVAWRTRNDEEQHEWREELARLGYNVTPIVDRRYFRSIYFREPGGVLFEIATDPPGFTTDESPETLGAALKLPPWLEGMRGRIERVLPPIHPPGTRTRA